MKTRVNLYNWKTADMIEDGFSISNNNIYINSKNNDLRIPLVKPILKKKNIFLSICCKVAKRKQIPLVLIIR